MENNLEKSFKELFSSLSCDYEEEKVSEDKLIAKDVKESSYFNYLCERLNKGMETFCKKNKGEDVLKFKDSFLSALKDFGNNKSIIPHSFSVNIKSDSGVSYVSFYLDKNSFEITKGGSTQEEALGFDTFCGWMYSIDHTGNEDTDDISLACLDEIERYLIDSAAYITASLPENLAMTSEKENTGFFPNPYADYDEDDF